MAAAVQVAEVIAHRERNRTLPSLERKEGVDPPPVKAVGRTVPTMNVHAVPLLPVKAVLLLKEQVADLRRNCGPAAGPRKDPKRNNDREQDVLHEKGTTTANRPARAIEGRQRLERIEMIGPSAVSVSVMRGINGMWAVDLTVQANEGSKPKRDPAMAGSD